MEYWFCKQQSSFWDKSYLFQVLESVELDCSPVILWWEPELIYNYNRSFLFANHLGLDYR